VTAPIFEEPSPNRSAPQWEVTLKFDIFSEQQMAKPWEPSHEQAVFANTIAQAKLADQCGYGCWWSVEHHGAPEFSYSSAPELTLTAIALNTKQIHVGHSGVLSPVEINHPVRVAERGAVLDILSGGRLEMGLARSGGTEWETFGVDGETTNDQLVDLFTFLGAAWTEESIKWDSRFLTVPERSVVPKPLQKPHPRLWQTCSSPDAFFAAGKRGVGVLGTTLLSPLSLLASCLSRYDEGRKELSPVSRVDNNQKAVFTFLHCAETKEQAIASRAAECAMWYVNAAPQVFAVPRTIWTSQIRGEAPDTRAIGATHNRDEIMVDMDPDDPIPLIRLLNRQALGMEIDPVEAYEVLEDVESVIIGDVDLCTKKARAYANIGVERLMSLQQFGFLKHDDVMSSIRLTGEYLIPALG
jgi:alkanesulfonate monooxygenase SsuD/methylene tetrahydromethanopterin reductase-like flavin-dependent oxidoreductase (luciferase family)